jgi:hypothetical protein
LSWRTGQCQRDCGNRAGVYLQAAAATGREYTCKLTFGRILLMRGIRACVLRLRGGARDMRSGNSTGAESGKLPGGAAKLSRQRRNKTSEASSRRDKGSGSRKSASRVASMPAASRWGALGGGRTEDPGSAGRARQAGVTGDWGWGMNDVGPTTISTAPSAVSSGRPSQERGAAGMEEEKPAAEDSREHRDVGDLAAASSGRSRKRPRARAPHSEGCAPAGIQEGGAEPLERNASTQAEAAAGSALAGLGLAMASTPKDARASASAVSSASAGSGINARGSGSGGKRGGRLAEMAYQKALDEHPASAEAAFKFASYLERERRHLESAQNLYVQALRNEPQHVPSLLGLARCRTHSSELPAAAAAPPPPGSSIDGAVRPHGDRDRDSPAAGAAGGTGRAPEMPKRGDGAVGAGAWALAVPVEELYGRALALMPTSVEAAVGRAQALFNLHRAQSSDGFDSLERLEESRLLFSRAVAAGEWGTDRSIFALATASPCIYNQRRLPDPAHKKHRRCVLIFGGAMQSKGSPTPRCCVLWLRCSKIWLMSVRGADRRGLSKGPPWSGRGFMMAAGVVERCKALRAVG